MAERDSYPLRSLEVSWVSHRMTSLLVLCVNWGTAFGDLDYDKEALLEEENGKIE